MTFAKRIAAVVALVAAFGLLQGAPLRAQEQPAPSQKQLDWAAARAQRKAIVGANMALTADEAKAFWPIYEQYQNKMQKFDQRQAAEIKAFAKNYQSLTNEQATQRLNEVMNILEGRLKVEREFVPRFEKVIPAIKVARFYQIDHKLRALIQCQIAQAVPLAKAPNEQ